jgi:hypothetical protein
MNSVKADNQEPIPNQVQTILHLFDTTELTLRQIAKEVGSTYRIVFNRVAKFRTVEERNLRWRKHLAVSKLGVLNPMKGKTLESHPNYKGECSDCKGYTTVVKPNWYNKNCRRVFTHHVKYCEYHGLDRIPEGLVVHHMNGNKLDNSKDNLQLLTKSEHTKLHCVERRRD